MQTPDKIEWAKLLSEAANEPGKIRDASRRGVLPLHKPWYRAPVTGLSGGGEFPASKGEGCKR